MSYRYDPKLIEGHFDGETLSEWERMEKHPRNLVSFHIHKHYLKEYIKPGDKVIDIGSGPGKYTIELARLGAKIAVADISSEMLKLHKAKMEESGCEEAVLWRRKLDIIDLSSVPDNSFDAAIAYGGPLSYVFDLASDALAELLRVTRPGGYVFLGVMSSLGTWRFYTESVLDEIQEFGLLRYQKLFEDGDVTGRLAAKGTHHCHMFRWSELRSLIEEHSCEILEVSACSFLANNKYIQRSLEQAMQNLEVWNAFLRWELEFSREPGAIDASSHIIVVLRNNG